MAVLTAWPSSVIVLRMAHGKWSEVEARGVLEAWRRSGLPLDRYARQRGFVPQRLHWWKEKFAARERFARESSSVQSPTAALLPVSVTSGARRGEPVTVLLRTGHMLKVSHGFDEDAFARVVALLEGT
jgi:hypothetical protein